MTLVWRPGFQFDADASTYIEAVEVADGQALETGVRYAINDFVIGCKNDGIWNAIKASCILAGARTLEGALVPLVGTEPTKQGAEADWSYNRETGLQGNGIDNFLDSSRANNADPQDSNHNSVYVTAIATNNAFLIGNGAGSGDNSIYRDAIRITVRSRNSSAIGFAGFGQSTGLTGHSRSLASSFTVIDSKQTATGTVTSQSPSADNVLIYGFIDAFTNARISFYSIGESLDLAALDARVSALMTAIGAAIP